MDTNCHRRSNRIIALTAMFLKLPDEKKRSLAGHIHQSRVMLADAIDANSNNPMAYVQLMEFDVQLADVYEALTLNRPKIPSSRK